MLPGFFRIAQVLYWGSTIVLVELWQRMAMRWAWKSVRRTLALRFVLKAYTGLILQPEAATQRFNL
jgi:hypothetical protein